MSVWSFVLYVLLPIGVVLLGILTIPLPAFLSNTPQCRSIRGITLKLLHRLLFTNLNGTLPLAFIHLLLLILFFITGILGNEVLAEYRHHSHSEHGHHHAHADVLMMQQGKLWRHQRNCYLALAALITYWALYCVLLYQERIHRLEEILHTTPTHARTQPQSQSQAQSQVQSQTHAVGSSNVGPQAGASWRESTAMRAAPSAPSSVEGEGIPKSSKLEKEGESAAETDSEELTDNPLLRQRFTAALTPQPTAPPAALMDPLAVPKKDK